ncbi:hypothetical protein ACAG39_06595 [Caldicellulosiruptoraceae bacterium PP1]
MCMTVPLSFLNKKVNILSGTAGSGKSELALNIAFDIGDFLNINLIDADVINYYFNLRNVKDLINKKNIKFITTHFENAAIDLPIMSGEIINAIQNDETVNIIDVGGDALGISVLAQYKEIFEQKGYNLFYVLNVFRPENSTTEKIIENMNDIESILNLNINGIINCSHLLDKTTIGDVISSLEIAQKISEIKNVPYTLTVINEKLFEQELIEEIKKYSLVYAIKKYIIRE